MKKSILLLSMFSLLGCVPTLEGVDAPVAIGKVVLVLETDVPAFQKPIARVAQESALTGDLWVLVFKGSDQDATFEEAVKASVGTGGSRSVVLTKQVEAVRILVLANAPVVINNADREVAADVSFEFTPLTTYAEAVQVLTTEALSAVQPVNPYDGELLPMSISIDRPEITSSTSLGTSTDPLRLKRVVAKIAVRKDFVAPLPAFVLRGVAVCGAPRNGALFPTPVPKSNIGNFCDYQAPDPDPIMGISPATAVRIDGIDYPQGVTTEGNPIYLYEALSAERPFLILQARYSTDVQDTYYKLALPLRNVERNTYYRLSIKSVSGSGYTTLEEAKTAPANNLLRFDVEVTDLSSHDLSDNGSYFMGVSNSEFMHYGDNVEPIVLSVAELSHNAPLGITTATATATAAVVPLSPFDNPASFDGTPRTALSLSALLPVGFDASVLTLRLGNLTKFVHLSRHPSGAIPEEGKRIDDFLASDYKMGEIVDPLINDWVRFSFSPDTSNPSAGMDRIETHDGGFYIHVFPNAGGRRSAELFIGRIGGAGRLKLRIEQRASVD